MNEPRSPYKRRRRPGADAEEKQQIAVDIAGRTPPHNEDAEAAVISSVLLDGRVLDELLDIMPDGRGFFNDAHRRIYDVAVHVHSQGRPVDIQTVAAELRDRDRLQAVGGISYLTKIVDATPSVVNVRAHAKIVVDKFRVRQLIEQCQLTAAEGHLDYGTAQEFIDKHEQAVFGLTQAREGRDYVNSSTLAKECVAFAQRAMERPDGVSGAPTGLDLVDERTGGYQAGDLVIIGARPGMGKSALVIGAAVNMASIPQKLDEDGKLVKGASGEPIESGYVVAVFALEMPKEQLGVRAIAQRGGLDVSRVRKGKLGEKWGIYLQCAEWLSTLPIVWDDSPSITLLEMRAKLRRIQREHPLRKLIALVDYLQLMGAPPGVTKREEVVAANSRGLKAIAMELRIPVLAVSSLNRDVETRGGKDKRPQLSDLRESGAVESDADLVQFIYRPEYYVEQAGDPVPEDLAGYAEVITAKQRNGATGVDKVAFRKKSTRFETATVADMQRWGLDEPCNGPEQKKMFAPGSKLPGASQGN